jgi:hypothetical protein
MAPSGAFDLDAYLGTPEIGLRGESRSIKRQLEPLRGAMDEVFNCTTAFGDCHPDYPSAGHCMLSAMVIQDLFGGCIRGGTIGGIPHYWNEVNALHLDLTADQFGFAPIRVSKQTLYPDSFTFHRNPQERLSEPYNKKVNGLHRKFRTKLIPVLRSQGMGDYAKRLKQRNK